ncbi:MAG TPA: hypothetical protein VEJ21_06480 [Acidimicrobiales bacterium]|nr:hypothetical protein [Acidimicrobiales bacterium]
MRRLLFALASALGAGLVGGALAGTGPATASGGGSGHTQPTLTLLSQSPWVGPGQAMQLHLDIAGAPLGSLSLGVTLYDHLTSRSAFAETADGVPEGAILASTTVSPASLPSGGQGSVSLTIPVASGDAPSTGSGPLVADLDCPPGSCGGVYPLRLQLFSSSVDQLSSLFTYLVYADPPAGTQKVRVALVLPWSLSSPSSPSGVPVTTAITPQVSDTTAAALTSVLQVLATHPADPLTVAPEPASVEALDDSSLPAARTASSSLQSLAADPARQVLSGPFVPADATALVSAGLSQELTDQVQRGQQVLAGLHPATGTWVAAGQLDEGSMAVLGSLGLDRLVVPPQDVSQGSGPSLTSSAPFTLSAGHGVSLTAVETDNGFSADLAAGSGTGEALGAYRLLADLALAYYEEPNDLTPRGVVAMAPTASSTNPSMLDPAMLNIVLTALQGDPLLSPVTLDELFDQVPASLQARRVVPAGTTSSLPAHQIRAARARLDAFAGAVSPSGADVVHALDDDLLLSENAELRSSQQQQALSAFDGVLDQQLHSVSIRTGTIKLTSTAAKVPLTLTKQSGYGVTGILQVTGDKVVFPGGAAQNPGPVCLSWSERTSAGRSTFTCLAAINLANNAVYVDMRARVAGDFRLTVTLDSPTGGLVLASNHITVHSMSTSLVAVGLSIAAVVVLLTWWRRTLRRRPPARRGAHVRRHPVAAQPTS